MHGGSAPQVRAKAAKRLAEVAVLEVARQYGIPRDVSAIDALTEELHRTQGHVDWLSQQLDADRDPGWLAVYQSERAHLARLSHQMIILRTDERRTVLSEKLVDGLELALTGILRELGHSASDPHVRTIIARHMRGVAGQQVQPNDDVTFDAVIISDDLVPEPLAF